MSSNKEIEEARDELKYDPDAVLLETSIFQTKILRAVDSLDPKEVIKNKDMFEQAVSLANGMNNTAVQMKKAKIEEDSNKHIGALADVIMDQLVDKGLSTIKTVGNETVTKRKVAIDIDNVECESFSENMLKKGISTQNYDDFADEHGLPKDD